MEVTEPAHVSVETNDTASENMEHTIPQKDTTSDDSPQIMQALRECSLEIMSAQSIGGSSSGFLRTISGKITPEHISSIIKNSDTSEKRAFFLQIIVIAAIVGVFVWVTYFLAKDSEILYKDIIKLIVTFLGGVGVGYGVKSHTDKD